MIPKVSLDTRKKQLVSGLFFLNRGLGLRVLNKADHKNMLKKDQQKSQVLGKGSQLCPEDQIHANRHINLGDISSYGFHNFF